MLYRLFVLFFVLASALHAKEPKFLLLLGPSGVGKSTIIHQLKKMDSRFVYISPYTTRELREGEIDKIHIELESMKELENNGELLTVNEVYGIYYATPKDTIDRALEAGNIPVLDWPIEKLEVMEKNYGPNLLKIYILPENLEILKSRLDKDGRDKDGKRFSAGIREFEKLMRGEFDHLIHYKMINRESNLNEAAQFVYQKVLEN